VAVQISFPQPVSPDELRDIVLDKGTALPRMRALNLLYAANLADKQAIFTTLLLDEADNPRIRYQAAMHLYRINTPEIKGILLNGSQQIEDTRVLVAVVKALGRLGDEQALPVVSRIAVERSGRVASEARFAASLIAHRLGLPGHNLSIPAPQNLVTLSAADTHPFRVIQASQDEIQIGLSSLADESFGINYLKDLVYQLECEARDNLLIFLNQELAAPNALNRLSERKALPAIIASKSEETGRYSTALLVLSSPGDEPTGQLHVLVHRPDGQQVFAGTAQISGRRAVFSLRSVERPGVFAIKVEGILEAGQLTFQTALSAFRVHNRRQPSRG
jgi:hypothetical protein